MMSTASKVLAIFLTISCLVNAGNHGHNPYYVIPTPYPTPYPHTHFPHFDPCRLRSIAIELDIANNCDTEVGICKEGLYFSGNYTCHCPSGYWCSEGCSPDQRYAVDNYRGHTCSKCKQCTESPVEQECTETSDAVCGPTCDIAIGGGSSWGGSECICDSGFVPVVNQTTGNLMKCTCNTTCDDMRAAYSVHCRGSDRLHASPTALCGDNGVIRTCVQLQDAYKEKCQCPG